MESNSEKIPFMVDVFPALIKKEYIDVEMTEKVRQHLESNSSDFLEIEEESTGNFLVFENFRFDYENLISCDDVKSPYNGCDLLEERVAATEILESFKIKVTNCIALSLYDDDTIRFDGKWVYRKYLIFVFSNTILVFIDPKNKPIAFLCALHTTALSLDFDTCVIEEKVVVRETSREPLDYYKTFNPVPDSRIISMNWEVTNRDGSRSFRGGLYPENNPLHMRLEYGTVTINVCGTHGKYAFSNADLARKVTEEYSAYMAGKAIIQDNDLQKEEIYKDSLQIVADACKEESSDARKKTLIERYKALHPIWRVLIPFFAVYGIIQTICFLCYIIAWIWLILT